MAEARVQVEQGREEEEEPDLAAVAGKDRVISEEEARVAGMVAEETAVAVEEVRVEDLVAVETVQHTRLWRSRCSQ